MLKRYGALGTATALITAGYYLWIIGGYLNVFYMILEWIFTLAGAVIIARSLVLEPVVVNRFFEGKRGIMLGSLFFALALLITLLERFSQIGYFMIELFLFAISIFIIANSITSRPFFENKSAARATSLAGLIALPFVMAYYSFLIGAQAYLILFMIACGIIALLEVIAKGSEIIHASILIAVVSAFAYVLMQHTSPFSTDELALNVAAAKLFLHGANPYATSLHGVLAEYGLTPDYVTPLRNGGYVEWLSYPALSFLIYIPSILAGLQARVTLVAFTILALILLYIASHARGREFSIIAMLIFLVDVNVIYYPVGSVPDIIWAFFLALSFLLRKKAVLSGVMFGLSLASKQIPALVFPFFFYMIYRESGRKKAFFFLAAASVSFLLPNAPFIAMNAHSWLSAILAPLTDPLIGVGQGVSMISFLGYYQVKASYFVIMQLFLFAALAIFYIRNYSSYKYSFFAFPIIIFFFDYRSLFNYFTYWPFLSLLAIPEAVKEERAQNRKIGFRSSEVIFIVCCLAFASAAAFAFHQPESNASITLAGYGDPAGIQNYISSITLNISTNSQLQFRIFDLAPLGSVNGLMWHTVNTTEGDGWTLYTIEPNSALDILPADTAFRIDAYNSYIHLFYSSAGLQAKAVKPHIINPQFYSSQGEVPLGWSFSPNLQGGEASFAYYPDGIILSAYKTGNGWAAAQILQQFNLTYLMNYTLFYRVDVISSPNMSGSTLGYSGNPDIAMGVQIDAGDYEVWYLYSNSSTSYTMPNTHTIVIISNNTYIDFADAYSLLRSIGWQGNSAQYIMFMAGSQYTKGEVQAAFYDLKIVSSSTIHA